MPTRNLFLAIPVISAMVLGVTLGLCLHQAAAQDKPIALTVASWSPAQQVLNRGIVDPWIKEVEKRTNGRAKITNMSGRPWASLRSITTLRLRESRISPR
jgi:TRAP-type C4-dicarboxylate transport system substrate-binding protein